MKVSTKNNPEKSLTRPIKKTGGRNNQGRITVRHQGGGVKRKYRIIEFAEKDMPFVAKVESIEYDPNRTCNIALISYNDKKAYILAPEKLKAGDTVEYAEKAEMKPGNRMQIKNYPNGTIVYNIELLPGCGGKLARSAGGYVEIRGHEGKYTSIKLPSSEVRKVLSNCYASYGEVSNKQHRFEEIGSAGKARRMGRRPTVRGSVMNATDHPHGGGKNKQPIGMHPKTPWGKPALGVKTRKKKKWSDKLILQRRKKNK